jgi:hypothetical protein
LFDGNGDGGGSRVSRIVALALLPTDVEKKEELD